MSPALTKPCFSQLPWHSLLVPGTCLFVRAVQLVEHSHWSSLCSLPFLHCPSRFPHVIGDNLWGRAELRLSALGTDTPCVIAVSCICQAGWVSACWARQIFIKRQDLPNDIGDLSEYSSSSNLGIFSEAVGSSVYCSIVSPFSSKCFISYFCKGRPPAPPGLWICCLCSQEVWGSPLNLWSLLTLLLIAPWQWFWVFTIIPSVLLRSSTSQTPIQGSNVACSRSLGSASASFASDWYLTPVKSVPAFPSLSVEPRFHPIGRNEFFLCTRWISQFQLHFYPSIQKQSNHGISTFLPCLITKDLREERQEMV